MKVTLNEILKQIGKTEQDITKIYRGKDRFCRCGCGGRYFEPGERGFTRAVNEMNKDTFDCYESPEIEKTYINFSYDDSTYEGRALTVYFD